MPTTTTHANPNLKIFWLRNAEVYGELGLFMWSRFCATNDIGTPAGEITRSNSALCNDRNHALPITPSLIAPTARKGHRVNVVAVRFEIEFVPEKRVVDVLVANEFFGGDWQRD